MYIQWVLLRRGSAYAPALRDAGLISRLQQEAGLRGEKSEKSPGDWLARFFSTWVKILPGSGVGGVAREP